MLVIEIVCILFVVLYLAYRYGTNTYDHWEKRGVPGIKPKWPFFGNNSPMMLRQTTILDFIQELRDQVKQYRYAGVFNFRQPVLLINDPELLKLILVKDFDYFVNRNRINVDSENDPILGKSLVSIEDQQWRDMRNILSPTFTSSKMKNMFQFIDQTSIQLVEYIKKSIDKHVNEQHPDGEVLSLEMKDLFTRFTSDVIATAAFGIKVDSLEDPENEFYRIGRSLTRTSAKVIMKTLLLMAFPRLMQKLKITVFGEKVNKFYTDLVSDTVKERDEKNIVRPDMIHLLMQARSGVTDAGAIKPGLSDKDIVSQAVLFFFAGFDTVSTFLAFAAYELAVNPDVQTRLQAEIDSVIEEDDGKLTYEGLMVKMKYLEAFCCEVLRKWPPAPFVDRRVSKKYKIEGENGEPDVYLDKEDIVWVPIAALHHDPQYFPEPEKFDPERFYGEHKNDVNPFVYMPFGVGPRNCIGMRFALMESKACLTNILRNFTLMASSKTEVPMKLSKKNMRMAPDNGFWIGFRTRN